MPRQPWLERAVAARLEHDDATSALRLIDVHKGLPLPYASLLRGEVARALFTRNQDSDALRVARLATRATPPQQGVGLVSYFGGLAAWRLADTAEARRLFSTAAAAGVAPPSLRAAAAFWTAPAADREHDPVTARQWLQRAAEQRFTLYGMLARRMLGRPTGITPSGVLLSQADVDAVAATDAGWRAFALLQVGSRRRHRPNCVACSRPLVTILR